MNRRRFLTTLGAFGAATAGWTASLSTVLGPREGTLTGDPEDPVIAGLIAAQLAHWEGARPAALHAMRGTNPEWDFMGRTFAGLAFLNVALRRPALADRAVAAVDRMITATLADLERHGPRHYLLSYANRAPFVNRAGRSLFVDGELATLIAARHLVAGPRFDAAQDTLVRAIADHLDASPLGHGESYPDECWAFCNSFAIAALALDTATRGTDHGSRIARYLSSLRSRLCDPVTGMLVSEYTISGAWMDGPEGSSIFLTASLLDWVDPAFAADQYRRARHHLGRGLLGFAWAREWPATWRSAMDVDSGPVVPVLDASPGASGLAFVGAGAFGDTETLSALLASLELAAFPTWEGDALRYAGSNAVGDAVLLYSLVQGPLRERVRGSA